MKSPKFDTAGSRRSVFSFPNLVTKRFGTFLPVLALLLSLFVTAPAVAGISSPSASAWGFTQYIWSFFFDDDANSRGKMRPAAASPYDERETGATGQRYAPPIYPDAAVPCTQSGTTTSVPLGQNIQTYINAAGFNGDKLVLAAGTYTGQITLNKCIFIEGAGIGQTIIKAPAVMLNSEIPGIGTRQSIVEARANAYSSISNLTISGPVEFDASTYGVFVAENAWLVMNGVHVTDIRLNSTNDGNQNGNGIVVGTSGANQIGRLEAANVIVDHYNKNGVVVDHLGSTASFVNGTVTGSGPQGLGLAAQNGIQFSNGATGTVTGSTITGNEYTDPSWAATGLLTSASGNVTFSGNILGANSESIYTYSPSQTPAVVTIENNTVTGGDWGILAYGVDAVIERNNVTGSEIGIGMYVRDATTAAFTANSVTGTTVVGIDVDNFSLSTPAVSANVSGSFNRISGNSIGMYNGTGGSVNAENNFWGCNDGPGGVGCDTTGGSGLIDFDPWLTLSSTLAASSPIDTGQTSAISGTSLRINSDSVDTYNSLPGNPHVLDGLTVSYSATNGSVLPTSGTFTSGLAAGTTFTAGGPFQTEETGVITAAIDNAANSANVIINDNDPPTVTINQAAGQADPTNSSPITFDVVFNENVTGFDASDILTTGSTAGITLVTVDPVGGTSQTHYTVTVDVTSSGIVQVSVPAGAANDTSANANPNEASTSTDNQVAYFSGSIELVVDEDGVNCLANGAPVYTNIPDAVAAANPGYLIRVCSGTYSLTGNHIINKLGLTIMNAEAVKPLINITGGGNLFRINASDITISGMNFNKTDGVAQHVISIGAGNFTAANNEFTALPWAGTGTTRAFEVSGGVSNMLLDGNVITDFRQPAYINGGGITHVGTISNNVVTRTKGWVVDGAMADFIGNSFTTCAACDTDIALIEHDATPAVQAFYADRLALSNANNNAHVDVQFTTANDSGRANTYVATTGSATNDGQSGSPFANIQQAIYDPASGIVDGTLPGGTVHVAAGTYTPGNGISATGQVLVDRAINVIGEDRDSTIIDGQGLSGSVVKLETPASVEGNTMFSGFTVTNPGGSGTRVAILIKPLSTNSTVTVSNSKISGIGNQDYGVWTYRPRGPVVLDNNLVSGTGYNPILIEQALSGIELRDNTINASSSVFNMTYSGEDIAAAQLYEGNTLIGSSISVNSGYGGGAGKFSNVQILNNRFLKLGSSQTAISITNQSTGGTAGEITGVSVSENYVQGNNPVSSMGVRLTGLISAPSVACNTFTGAANAVVINPNGGGSPSSVTVNQNNFSGNNFGIMNYAATGVNGESNYWGAADGPAPADSGDEVSANVDFDPFLTSVSSCAPALPDTHIPSTANGWYYYDDAAEGLITPNDYAYGPTAPPLGIGSARMFPSSVGTTKLLFATQEFNGTRFDELNHFSYFAYVTNGDAPYGQFGIDDDLTDGDTSWKGRIVWVPSDQGTVVTGAWQFWNVDDGLYYGTQAPINGVCNVTNRCTRSELMAAFPNLGISANPLYGFIGFRSDDAWDVSVDAVSVGTNTVFKTFDFEPLVPTLTSITHAPAGPTNQPIAFTVTFSEPVTGFDGTDTVFTGINGTHTVTGGPTVYTVTFTPDAGQDGMLSLNIAAGAANAVTGGSPTSNGGTDSVDFDNIAPGVTLGYSGSNPTNNAELHFEANFTEDVNCFTVAGVTAVNGTVSNIVQTDGNTCTFTVTAASNGTVSATVNAGATADAAGNGNTASSTFNVTFDDARPSVTIGLSTVGTSSVTFNVIFSEPVAGFDPTDVDLGSGTTGGILSATVTDTGDHMNYTVVVTGMANDGNVVISIPENGANDLSGNGNTASNELITPFDATDSGVTVTPTSAPGQFWSYYNDSTNAPIAGYDFMFGPTGVTNGIGSAGLRTSVSIPGNPGQLLTFGTSSFNGTELADITRLSYKTYVDSSSAGDVPTLQFNVDFDLTDSNVSYQGRVVWVPSQNGTVTNNIWQTWDVVTANSLFWYSNLAPFAGECTAGDPCTLAEMLAAHPNMGVHDSLGALLFRVQGNSDAAVDNLVVGVNSANTTFDFEPSVPTLVSITHSPAGPTNASPIVFTVTFSEPVTGFDGTDTVFTGISGTHTVTGGPTVYTVTFTPAANQTGSLTLDIAAGAADGDPSGVPTSNAGNNSLLGYDNAAPTVTIDEAAGQTDPTSSSPINFTVEFSETVSGFDALDIVLDPGTSGASNVVVSGGPSSYNVAVSGMNADGIVSISFLAGAAADGVGNPSQTPVITDGSVEFALSNTDVVVTPVNLQSWETISQRTGSSSLVSGIDTPPLGTGSLRLFTGPGNAGPSLPGGSSGQGGKTWFSHAGFATPLSSITELSYSTYVAQRMLGTDVAPAINLQVDIDGNGTRDAALVYEPAYSVSTQGPIVEDQWQNWNALNGDWWFTGSTYTNAPSFPAQFCPSGCFNSWSDILAAFPQIAIVDWYPRADGNGLQLVGGQNDPGSPWGDFDGNVDNFVIGVNSVNTTYDFEPTPPTISVDDVTVNEGHAGASVATFTVSISQASQLDTIVSVSTADGTATTADSDYAGLSDHVVAISAGSLTATFDVNINGDVIYENDESFDVVLSDAVNGVIADGTGTGTITNDEALPTVSVTHVSGGSEPATPNTFAVTLSGQSSFAVTVNATTANGTATAGSDYTASNTVVTFPAGTSTLSQNVVVATLNDLTPESAEDFTLNLSSPTNATIGTASATGTIADSGLYVSISGNITQFGGAGVDGVTVQLSGSSNQTTVTSGGGNYIFNVGLPVNGTFLIVPGMTGKVFDPTNRSYVNVLQNVQNADFVAYDLGSVPRNLRVETSYQSSGPGNGVVQVPVTLDSLGTEKGLSFSLTYDPSLLDFSGIACGNDAIGCDLSYNDSLGSLGVEFTHDTVFSSGNGRQVVVVTFNTTPGSASNTPVAITDLPAIRDVNDAEGNSLPSNYLDGLVVFPQGFEGDLAARNTGNGILSGADTTILRQFVAGSLSPNPAFNEFQRADVSPAGSKGGGTLTSADVTVLRLYISNSTLTPVGGPSAMSSLAPLTSFVPDTVTNDRRKAVSLAAGDIRVVDQTGQPGDFVVVPLELDSGGNENGVTASVQFDSSVLTYVNAALGPDASGLPGTTFDTNITQVASGRVGLSMTLNIGATFTPGPKQVFVLTFQINGAAPIGTTAVDFVSQPLPMEINDPLGNVLPINPISGVVHIASPSAAGVAVQGQVLTAGGSPVAGAQVILTNDEGRSYSARSNTFGNFGIKGIPGGRTYILSGRAKGLSFPAQTVTLNQSVTTVNLVSD